MNFLLSTLLKLLFEALVAASATKDFNESSKKIRSTKQSDNLFIKHLIFWRRMTCLENLSKTISWRLQVWHMTLGKKGTFCSERSIPTALGNSPLRKKPERENGRSILQMCSRAIRIALGFAWNNKFLQHGTNELAYYGTVYYLFHDILQST